METRKSQWMYGCNAMEKRKISQMEPEEPSGLAKNSYPKRIWIELKKWFNRHVATTLPPNENEEFSDKYTK